MVVFNNIKLSFIHNGHEISGILRGDLLNWEFITDDNVFRTYFPSGILIPRICPKNIDLDYEELLNNFYSQADKLITE